MKDEMFSTQAIKQMVEPEENVYGMITILLLTTGLHTCLQLMIENGMQVS